jgi:hypothetical protein
LGRQTGRGAGWAKAGLKRTSRETTAACSGMASGSAYCGAGGDAVIRDDGCLTWWERGVPLPGSATRERLVPAHEPAQLRQPYPMHSQGFWLRLQLRQRSAGIAAGCAHLMPAALSIDRFRSAKPLVSYRSCVRPSLTLRPYQSARCAAGGIPHRALSRFRRENPVRAKDLPFRSQPGPDHRQIPASKEDQWVDEACASCRPRSASVRPMT